MRTMSWLSTARQTLDADAVRRHRGARRHKSVARLLSPSPRTSLPLQRRPTVNDSPPTAATDTRPMRATCVLGRDLADTGGSSRRQPICGRLAFFLLFAVNRDVQHDWRIRRRLPYAVYGLGAPRALVDQLLSNASRSAALRAIARLGRRFFSVRQCSSSGGCGSWPTSRLISCRRSPTSRTRREQQSALARLMHGCCRCCCCACRALERRRPSVITPNDYRNTRKCFPNADFRSTRWPSANSDS